MKEILSYNFFTTPLEFENWQNRNPDFKISQIHPMPAHLNISMPDNTGTEADIKNELTSIFVVYIKPSRESDLNSPVQMPGKHII